MELTAPKPTPKPRLSKVSVPAAPPPPPTVVVEALSNDENEEKNGFDSSSSLLTNDDADDSKLDSLDEETSEILDHFQFLDRPDSLGNGIISSSSQSAIKNTVRSNNGSISSPLEEKSDNINAVENPQYVSFPFLRRDKDFSQSTAKHRASDLMWFNSGVPQEFLSKDTKISPSTENKQPQRLYPDLDAFLFNESVETAFNVAQRDSTSIDHSIPSPIREGAPKRLSMRSVISASNREEIVDYLDDDRNDPNHFDDGKLVFNDSQTISAAVTPTNDDRSMASVVSSIDLNEDDVIGSRDSLPPLPVQPRNPTPVIVSHPHRHSSTSSVPTASNVCYVGFLSKLGQKKKDNTRRWSVLQHGIWSFFHNETDEKPSEIILCKNITLVTIESHVASSKDAQQLNDVETSFGVYLNKDGGKVDHVTFSADCVEDRTAWLTFLAKSIIHGETAELCERIDRAGSVYLKQGTTAEWEVGWLVLIGAKLLYSCQTDVCSFEIDVRKIIRLRTIDDHSDHCPMIKAGSGNPFVITTEGSALYVQAGNSIVTDTWKTGIETILLHRTSILPDQRLTFDDVPVLVEKCINFIGVHGMSVEGIHRLSGTSSKVRTLYEEFRKDPYSVHLRLEDYSVHDVASVLRKFFRQLNEPLVTTKLRPEFINKSFLKSISGIDEAGTRRNEFKTLLKQLPKISYRTLRKILGHLKSVADNSSVNMMNIQNLAAIFGPTLFSVDRDAVEGINFTSTSQAIMVIADMLMDYNRLFDVDESEMQKESRIQQIAKDLNNQPQMQKKPPAGELLLSIHTVERDGVCFNMPITNKLTPSDVCDFAVERRKLNALRDEVALFEVVCNGDLQRLILPDEKVLDVISRWTTWPLEERAQNFLIVKLDFVTDRVKNMAVGPTLFPTCEVQFSESKSFKKFTFQFTQGAIVQYKDSKAKKELNQWKAETLLWYFGCETKRQPPSKYCLTFLPKSDTIKRSKSFPFFGKTMSFKDEVDMYKWLCTVLLFNHSFLSKTEF